MSQYYRKYGFRWLVRAYSFTISSLHFLADISTTNHAHADICMHVFYVLVLENYQQGQSIENKMFA